MPSDSVERRPTKANQVGVPPATEQEHLPCPRCDSTNTKFCYYNNYNFSQPRHFCKACRRYWTHGGTLRDIPVGGGSRKNAKRCRTASATIMATATYATDNCHIITNSTPVLVHHGEPVPFAGEVKPTLNMFGSFTALLNTPGPGLSTVGGFGLGIGSGFEDVGFGLGRVIWPYTDVEDGGAANTGGSPGTMGNTWQLESGGGGFVSGECLTISTTGNTMK